MNDCGCGGGNYALSERIARMCCEGLSEERAEELANAMYADRCPGCGLEVPNATATNPRPD